MITLNHSQYVIGAQTRLVPASNSVITKTGVAASEEVFFSGLYDPLADATFDRLEAHCAEQNTSIAPLLPDMYTGTAADDATVGTEAWTNPTNAQGNTAATATVEHTVVNDTYTGTATDDSGVGTVAWTNISNVEGATGSSFAYATLAAGVASHYAGCSNFGLAIPANATILGVEVTSTTGATGDLIDNSVRLVKAGVASGDDKASALGWGSVTTRIYGGATDMWGLALTPADVNASNFGVAISAVDGSIAGDAKLYTVKIKIYYSILTHYLKCTNFGFAIPATATVVGVKVTLDSAGSTTNVFDNSVRLVKAGTVSGDAKTAGGNWSSITTRVYGYGATDMWGLTLTPADVNASNFGVVVSAKETEGVAAAAAVVATCRIAVYYTDTLTKKWAMRALADSGQLYTGTAADDATVGTVAWTDPTNAQGNSDLQASAVLGVAAESHYLKCTNFGFSIPSSATVVGVQAAAETAGSDAEIYDGTIKLVIAGAISGDNKENAASWGGGSQSWGGDNDLWGNTITAANVNASNFGVVISAESTTAAKTAKIKNVTLTVWFRANETLFSETVTLTTGTNYSAGTAFSKIFDGSDFVNAKAPFELIYLISFAGVSDTTVQVAPTGCLISAVGRYDE